MNLEKVKQLQKMLDEKPVPQRGRMLYDPRTGKMLKGPK